MSYHQYHHGSHTWRINMLAKIFLIAVTLHLCLSQRVIYTYKPMYHELDNENYVWKKFNAIHREPAPIQEEQENILENKEQPQTYTYYYPKATQSEETFMDYKRPLTYKQYYQKPQVTNQEDDYKSYQYQNYPAQKEDTQDIESKYKYAPTKQYTHEALAHHQFNHQSTDSLLQYPSHKTKSEDEHVDYYAHPKYEYGYKVDDQHTGDNKYQHEVRDGDNVKGVYSFMEPNGSIRTVEYSSDKEHGFRAIVKHTAPTKHVHATAQHEDSL